MGRMRFGVYNPGSLNILIPIKSSKNTEKIIIIRPIIADTKSSFPACTLCGLPWEVITKNAATIIKMRAIPPLSPIAQGSKKINSEFVFVVAMQPTAVFIPVSPEVVVQTGFKGGLTTLVGVTERQQE